MATTTIDRLAGALERVGFGRRAWLPIGVSVAVHVLVVVAAATFVWRVVTPPTPPPPQSVFFDDPGLAGAPLPPESGVRRPAEVRTGQPAGPVSTPRELLTDGEATPSSSSARDPLSPGALLGQDSIDEAGLIDPATIVAEPGEAPPDSLGGALDVRFAGLGASSARSVVYVVDASGPMVTSLPLVLDELARSVDRLSARQRFNVVMYGPSNESRGEGVHAFASVLVPATDKMKARALAWARAVRPGGRSVPLVGLEAAIDLEPQAVFLLARSIDRTGGGAWGQGFEPTLTRLDELNPVLERFGRRGIVIRTIQFLEEDPTGIMQAIAERHGSGDGAKGYRVVERADELRDDGGEP